MSLDVYNDVRTSTVQLLHEKHEAKQWESSASCSNKCTTTGPCGREQKRYFEFTDDTTKRTGRFANDQTERRHNSVQNLNIFERVQLTRIINFTDCCRR